MKVLRHGNKHKEKECTRCGALLSYCLSDINLELSCEEYFGEIHSITKRYIVCPECKEKIMLTFLIDGKEVIK